MSQVTFIISSISPPTKHKILFYLQKTRTRLRMSKKYCIFAPQILKTCKVL